MKKNIKKLCQKKNSIRLLCIIPVLICIQQSVFGQTIVTTPRLSRQQTQQYKDSIILNGDLESWFWLSCTNEKDYPKFSNGKKNRYELEFPYVLILANRYDNPQACYDIYVLIKELYDSYHIKLDTNTIDFVLFYLNKGADLGSIDCLKELYYMYCNGINVTKDLNKANIYKMKLNSATEISCPKIF